jgi:hypothetical protein
MPPNKNSRSIVFSDLICCLSDYNFKVKLEWPQSKAFLERAKIKEKSRKPICKKFNRYYLFLQVFAVPDWSKTKIAKK